MRSLQIVQDIGQKVELENMANTDSLTGLFNERYFRVLNICEEKAAARAGDTSISTALSR